MAAYTLVVTDVTRYGPTFCVAGWDAQRGLMIRPEPPHANAQSEASRFWNGNLAGPGRAFDVGNLVQFEAAQPNPHFGFPHATEDRVIANVGTIVVRGNLGGDQFLGAVAGSVSPSVAGVFGGGLERRVNGKGSVAPGFNGPSLGAIELSGDSIKLHEEANFKGVLKLRARVNDGTAIYDFSVPGDDALTRWNAGGIEELQQQIAARKRVHLRLGLARAWADNPCYAQVNGIYLPG